MRRAQSGADAASEIAHATSLDIGMKIDLTGRVALMMGAGGIG